MFIVEASYSVVFCYSIPSWQVGNIICPMLLGTKWRHRTVEFSVKDHTAKKQGSQPVRLFLEPLPLHTLHKTQTTNVMLFVFIFRNFRRRPTVWRFLCSNQLFVRLAVQQKEAPMIQYSGPVGQEEFFPLFLVVIVAGEQSCRFCLWKIKTSRRSVNIGKLRFEQQ